MRAAAKAFVEKLVEEHHGLDPVWEFGSYQCKGQEGWADLRPIFPDREFVGADCRPGRGVDRVMDVSKLALPDASLGTVLCIDTLEHVRYPFAAAREMARVLKPDGLLVVATCFCFPIHKQPEDYWRFTTDGLRELFADADLTHLEVTADPDEAMPCGVYAWGIK